MASASLKNANLNHASVKRIMKEYRELEKEPSPMFVAQPLEDNLFEWHFTVRGADDTDFAGGRYHGRILLPADYPFKPPDIMMLTPNGRFQTNTKICLSISGFHPESWQPIWSIRTILVALIAFMPTPANGAIGSLEYSSEERKKYAVSSGDWSCSICGTCNKDVLPSLSEEERKAALNAYGKEQLPQGTAAQALQQPQPTQQPTASESQASPPPITASVPSSTPSPLAPAASPSSLPSGLHQRRTAASSTTTSPASSSASLASPSLPTSSASSSSSSSAPSRSASVTPMVAPPASSPSSTTRNRDRYLSILSAVLTLAIALLLLVKLLRVWLHPPTSA